MTEWTSYGTGIHFWQGEAGVSVVHLPKAPSVMRPSVALYSPPVNLHSVLEAAPREMPPMA